MASMDIRFITLFGALVLSTAGCGLRGDLERPAPIFGEGNDVEVELVDDSEAFEDEPEAVTGPRFNEFGGVIPDASPTEPVEESALPQPDQTPQ